MGFLCCLLITVLKKHTSKMLSRVNIRALIDFRLLSGELLSYLFFLFQFYYWLSNWLATGNSYFSIYHLCWHVLDFVTRRKEFCLRDFVSFPLVSEPTHLWSSLDFPLLVFQWKTGRTPFSLQMCYIPPSYIFIFWMNWFST